MEKTNFAEQYAGYFDAFRNAIDGMVGLIKNFYTAIKAFVDGFKKNLTEGEPFEDTDI